MNDTANSQSDANRNRIVALVAQFKALEARGAAATSHAEHDKRNEVLDELQDAVGLSGKMVMERDILRRAEQSVKAGS